MYRDTWAVTSVQVWATGSPCSRCSRDISTVSPKHTHTHKWKHTDFILTCESWVNRKRQRKRNSLSTSKSRWKGDLHFDWLEEVHAGSLGEAEEGACTGVWVSCQILHLRLRHLKHLGIAKNLSLQYLQHIELETSTSSLMDQYCH